MSKFSNIVIVSDMDGTFFGAKARIVPENMEAIKYFNDNGGHFTFITGRNHPAVACYPELMEIVTAPIGFHNGCYLFDTTKKRVLEEMTIPYNAVADVCRYLMSLSDEIDFTLRCAFSFHKLDGKNSRDYDMFINRFDCCSVVTYDQLKTLKVNKIVFSGDEEKVATVREHIEKAYTQALECTSASPKYVEIMPRGVTKATVIPKLKKLPGYENAKVFAIGDYENDVEMLKAADFGACPENAIDAAKDVAKIHVCHHDEGAVAHLIRIIEEKSLG